MGYWLPDPRGSTGRAQSAYWADADPEYLRHQRELGRDTSEYKPEIRLAHEAELHHYRELRDHGPLAGLKRATSGDALFGAGFETAGYPWYRRLFLRLRGWDA